jgi:tRNA-Thr(GGU) m(6)t(6)A37 methyltransferase TsaA
MLRDEIRYEPIGVVHSPWTSVEDMPVQPSRAGDVKGTVELFAPFVDALADVDGFSHLILITHLHRSRPWRPRVVPFLDTVERGLFATRSPSRPNPIGLSVVELVAVDGSRLTVRGVDLLDGTPLLDLKPYVGDFDGRPDARFGWLEAARAREARSDGRFS